MAATPSASSRSNWQPSRAQLAPSHSKQSRSCTQTKAEKAEAAEDDEHDNEHDEEEDEDDEHDDDDDDDGDDEDDEEGAQHVGRKAADVALAWSTKGQRRLRLRSISHLQQTP